MAAPAYLFFVSSLVTLDRLSMAKKETISEREIH